MLSGSSYRKTIEQTEAVFKLLKKIKDPSLKTQVEQKQKELALTLAAAYGQCRFDLNPISTPSTELKRVNINNDDVATPLLESKPNNNDKLAPNEFKADFYLAVALGLVEPEDATEYLKACFSWFTTTRLGFLRAERQYKIMADAYFGRHKEFLGNDFSMGQFSYLPEMMIGIYELFNQSLAPVTKENEKLYWYERFEWERFQQAFWEAGFLSFLTNAVVWLLVNGSAFLIGIPVVGAILNLSGFGFDIGHDGWFAHKEVKELEEILTLLELNNDDSLFKKFEFSDSLKDRLKKQLNGKEQEKGDIEKAKDKRWRLIAIAVGLFIGMAILYLPIFFSAWPLWLMMSAKVLGSSIVVGSGFFYGGLIGRLRRHGWNTQSKKNALAIGLLSTGLIVAASFYTASLIPPLWLFVAMCAVPLVLIAIAEIIRRREQAKDFSLPPLDTEKIQAEEKLVSELLDRLNKQLPESEEKAIDITLFQTVKATTGEMSALKHVANLTDREFARHVRCWSRESNQRESLLRYTSFNDFHKQLCEKLGKNQQPAPVAQPVVPPETEIKLETDATQLKSLVVENLVKGLSEVTAAQEAALELMQKGSGLHHSYLDKQYDALSEQANKIQEQITTALQETKTEEDKDQVESTGLELKISTRILQIKLEDSESLSPSSLRARPNSSTGSLSSDAGTQSPSPLLRNSSLNRRASSVPPATPRQSPSARRSQTPPPSIRFLCSVNQ